MVQLDETFGVSKNPVLSYLERQNVDGLFQDALRTDKQVIVYGSSKQGKTALVEKHAPYKDNVVIRCSPSSGIIDIYKSILRNHGIEVETEKEKSHSSETSVGVSAKVTAHIPLIGGIEVGTSPDVSAQTTETQKTTTIEFNLELPQDISELLRKVGAKKFIILENFHYLTYDLQKRLAFDLRNFQELGIRFIILGVWREKNRLTQYNGDLLDRIEDVPVEPWEKSDFQKVVLKGANALNIEFSKSIIDKIIENSFDSIGVVQELLKLTCKHAGITETQKSKVIIDNADLVDNAISEKLEDYSSRHVRSLEDIAEGRRANKAKEGNVPLYLPYYLVRAFLDFDFSDVVKGIRREQIESKIKSMHHRQDDVRPGDISNLLHRFAELQSSKHIIPPIFDYDQSTRTMRVVDSTFYFFLRNADRISIANNLINPLEIGDTD